MSAVSSHPTWADNEERERGGTLRQDTRHPGVLSDEWGVQTLDSKHWWPLVSMGAPAIYHIPNRRRSGCSAVINNATNTSNTGVNGLDRRILNYDKYLKVRLTILTDPLVAYMHPNCISRPTRRPTPRAPPRCPWARVCSGDHSVQWTCPAPGEGPWSAQTSLNKFDWRERRATEQSNFKAYNNSPSLWIYISSSV